MRALFGVNCLILSYKLILCDVLGTDLGRMRRHDEVVCMTTPYNCLFYCRFIAQEKLKQLRVVAKLTAAEKIADTLRKAPPLHALLTCLPQPMVGESSRQVELTRRFRYLTLAAP